MSLETRKPLSYLKASFVRPLHENKENIKPFQLKAKEIKVSDGFNEFKTPVNHSNDETKEGYLDDVNLNHSKLFASVEEIRKWKTSIEIESEQKNKKEEELFSTIELQRKQLLDLQLQNENLNIQLNEEIQQRSLVLEKLHSTKELCTALKKHYNTLQGHYEYGNRIEEIINITDAKRLKAIENLKIKFEKINADYSESVEYLKNALRDEESKVIELKEAFEIRLSESEKEKQSLCIMLQNCQSEVNRLTKEVDDEKNKLKYLLKEKNTLEATFVQMQESNKELACQLQDTQSTLKLVESNKIEIERRYLSDNNEMKELKKKYEESIESSKCLKTEYEDTIKNLKQTLTNSESKVLDMENKLKEEQLKFGVLSQSLQEAEFRRNELDDFVSRMKEDLIAYEVLKTDLKTKEQQIAQLLGENESLKKVVEVKCEDFSKCFSEKESLALLCDQRNEEILSLYEKQKNLELLIETETLQLNETVTELSSKLKVLEEDLNSKTELICIKEEEVSSLQSVLKEKETAIVVLSHEKSLIKETLEKEKLSAKNCMECQTLKEQLKNLKNLEEALSKAEQELKKEKKENAEHWKILSYTESRFNDTRVMQEKEILELQNEIRNLKDKLDITEVKLESANKLQSENASLKEEIENLKSNSIKEDDLSKQISENRDLKEEAKALNLKFSSLNKEMKKLKAENLSLKKSTEKLENYTEDLKCLKSENMNLKDELKQSKLSKNKEVKKLMAENLNLREKSEKLESVNNEDLKTLESENSILKEELKQLETLKSKELEDLITENSNLKQSNEKLENLHSEEVKSLQAENIRLIEEIQKLEDKYVTEAQSDVDEKIEPMKKKRKLFKQSSKACLNKALSPEIKKSENIKNDMFSKKKSPSFVPAQRKMEKINKTPSFAKDKLVATPIKNSCKSNYNSSANDKWETNSSSGSDVFEFVFDQGINGKVKGLSCKGSNLNNSSKSLSQTSPFVGGKSKTAIQEVDLKKKSATTKKINTNGIASNGQSNSGNFDFLPKENEKKDKGLWFQLKNPPRASPIVSTPRKFFKTPISDREVFKKPESKASPWF